MGGGNHPANTGLPDFQAFRRELGKPNSTQLICHAFGDRGFAAWRATG